MQLKNAHHCNFSAEIVAELVLKEYLTNGLWQVFKGAQGQYVVEKNKLPRKQYNAGLLIIKQKGNDGLNL